MKGNRKYPIKLLKINFANGQDKFATKIEQDTNRMVGLPRQKQRAILERPAFYPYSYPCTYPNPAPDSFTPNVLPVPIIIPQTIEQQRSFVETTLN